MPVVPRAPDDVFDVLNEVLEAASPVITAERKVVALVDDDFLDCCNGLLFIRLIRWYPTAVAPLQQWQSIAQCRSGFAVELDVVHFLCAPQLSTRGQNVSLPDPVKTRATMRQLTGEGWALTQAMVCLANQWAKDYTAHRNALIGNWIPIKEQSACVGGQLAMTVELIDGATC